jgi:hypothetical protein
MTFRRKADPMDTLAAGAPATTRRVSGKRLDALFGDGATRMEKALPLAAGFAGAGIVVGYAAVASLGWSWWQYALAVVLTADLVGGAVGNAVNSIKHMVHAGDAGPAASLVRNHVLFTAIHVQPIIIAAAFPGAGIWWGVLWYALTLGSVAAVGRVPQYLQRPVAMIAVAIAPVLAMVMSYPRGFVWLPVVLAAKLVLGAVREEPYRP